MTRDPKQVVQACLVGLALALLLVGIVSGTVLRHLIQIIPLVLALALVRRPPGLGAFAALPIFLFWILVVVLIWLFLLGLSNIASGRYTPIEVASTFVMFACSVVGVAGCVRLGREQRMGRSSLLFLLFTALQIVAMRISFLGPIANR